MSPAKHPHVKKEFGQAFIDWLTSPEGQKAIADYKINGQQLFFPDAWRFDGKRLVRTGLTPEIFKYLESPEAHERFGGPDGSQMEPDRIMAEPAEHSQGR